MVSSNKASLDLRETHPLSRNISHTSFGETRQRLNPNAVKYLKGCRCWSVKYTSTKVETGYSIYPVSGRNTAKSRIGLRDNRRLSYFTESIFVNVGDSRQNEKVSSPPMFVVSVGATIVVRGWESQPHGEGSQFVGIS
jgi:hypothetical protein